MLVLIVVVGIYLQISDQKILQKPRPVQHSNQKPHPRARKDSKSPGVHGGMVTGQCNTCINVTLDDFHLPFSSIRCDKKKATVKVFDLKILLLELFAGLRLLAMVCHTVTIFGAAYYGRKSSDVTSSNCNSILHFYSDPLLSKLN